MRAVVLIPRLRVAAVLLLALVVAGQLTLHQHVLIPDGHAAAPIACPACAFAADHAGLDTPLFSDALDFVGLLATAPAPTFASVVLFTSGVRGPPVSIR